MSDLFLLAVIYPFIPHERTRDIGRAVILHSAAALTLLMLVLLLAFPYPVAREIPLASYELSRLIYLGRFVQRMETLFLPMWAVAGLVSTATGLWAAAYVTSRALRLPHWRPLLPAVMVLVVAVAFIAPNVTAAIRLENEFLRRYFAPVITFGIPVILVLLARYREFRRSTFVMVVTGRARDVLEKTTPILEDNPAKYHELLFLGYKYTEFIPLAQFHYFYNAQKSLAQVPVAIMGSLQGRKPLPEGRARKSKGSYTAGGIPRQGGPQLEVMGGAVFRGGRMVGEMNGDELGIVNMLRGTFRRTISSIEDPRVKGAFVVVDIRPRAHPRVDVHFVEGVLDFRIRRTGLLHESAGLSD